MRLEGLLPDGACLMKAELDCQAPWRCSCSCAVAVMACTTPCTSAKRHACRHPVPLLITFSALPVRSNTAVCWTKLQDETAGKRHFSGLMVLVVLQVDILHNSGDPMQSNTMHTALSDGPTQRPRVRLAVQQVDGLLIGGRPLAHGICVAGRGARRAGAGWPAAACACGIPNTCRPTAAESGQADSCMADVAMLVAA